MSVPGPFLCQRKPATTQSAVRACLILAIARFPGAYASAARLAMTPSSSGPLEDVEPVASHVRDPSMTG